MFEIINVFVLPGQSSPEFATPRQLGRAQAIMPQLLAHLGDATSTALMRKSPGKHYNNDHVGHVCVQIIIMLSRRIIVHEILAAAVLLQRNSTATV